MSASADTFFLARQHHQAGDFTRAEQLYRQILCTDPGHAEAWCLLGSVCEGQGKLVEAEISYRRAIHLSPGLANAHQWLAIVLAQQGRLAEAVGSFQQAVRVGPHNAEIQHNLAVALDHLGRTAEAIASYRQALRLKPDFAQGYYNLGLALNVQGQHEEAIAAFRQAISNKPGYPEALNDLGNALAAQNKLDDALASYREALRLRPHYAEAHYNFGAALSKQAKDDEAIGHFRQALKLKPDFPEAHVHLGNALRLGGQMKEALASFEQALRLRPNMTQAHWNRATVWLLLGDFERGWPEYEWRWAQHSFARRHFHQPLWDGSPLGGRTLLLHAEQGLGDTLQFVRYIPLARERCGKVVLECPASLTHLLTGFPGVDELVATGSSLTAFDVQAPLLSLPGIFRTSLASIPAAVPYLRPKAGLVEHWRQELEPLEGFRIGIAWQGNPDHPDDRKRSIPLAFFAPLAAVPGVKLIGLQKGPGTDQLAAIAADFAVLDLGSRLDEASGPFMDTAAVMMNLNLVISSDTAIPHLAGALAVPVWLALTAVPDWRWLLGRQDNPWYPTMRLFRQKRAGGWEDVFREMALELEAR
jgi:tetratricopeptide (TPR) repeat protein